jgi:hypothetical protein
MTRTGMYRSRAFRVAPTLALAFGLSTLGVRASFAEIPEFHVPEMHSLELNPEELKGVGSGRTAPPPDIISNTDRLNPVREAPPPGSNMGRLPPDNAPPRAVTDRSPPRTGDAPSNNSAPKDAPRQQAAKEPPNQAPKETSSNNAPKEPPRETALKEEPKGAGSAKDDPKNPPAKKPSAFARHKSTIAIMGAMITVGVLLPVGIQALDNSMAQPPSANQ